MDRGGLDQQTHTCRVKRGRGRPRRTGIGERVARRVVERAANERKLRSNSAGRLWAGL